MAARLAFQDTIPGGLADEAEPAQFDPAALCQGLLVELEHTDDPKTALDIAMEHPTEDVRYYDALEEMEAGLEATAPQASMT